MSVEIKSNATELGKFISDFRSEMGAKDMRGAMHIALQMIANRSAEGYFKTSGIKESITAETASDKLTTRTGRLIGSIVGAPRFSNARMPLTIGEHARKGVTGKGAGAKSFNKGKQESIRKVSGRGSRVVGWIGSKVPYAGLHEFGGTVTTKVTPKAKSFFWYAYYQTGNPKFKAMALSSGSFTRTIPARPFLTPAANDYKKPILRMFIDMYHERYKKSGLKKEAN